MKAYIAGVILYIFPTHGTEVLRSVHSTKGHDMGAHYSQKGYKTNLTRLLFRITTSTLRQEMTSHTPYIFELRLPEVYGFCFIAILPSI